MKKIAPKSLAIPLFTIVLSSKLFDEKICFHCGSYRTIKNGKENGYQRWFCKDCKRYFIGRRHLKKEDVNSAYYLGSLTVSNLAREFRASTRTIHRYLSSEYKEDLPKLVSSNVVVLMDATYWGRRYREGISYLELHGYNVLGILEILIKIGPPWLI